MLHPLLNIFRHSPFWVISGSISLLLMSQTALAQFPISETFGGATTNDPNWTLNGSASLTNEGTGWLQLTTDGGGEAGTAILDDAFPATDGVVVEFEYAMHGGSGADGFSFFLFDGSVTSSPGAPGGALGYSSDSTISGISSAYVGIGFDLFGNFSSSVGGPGGPGVQEDAVVIRGSGDGTTGYNYLTGNSSLPSTLATGDRAGFHRVKISIVDLIIDVAIDFGDGSGFQSVISGFNLGTAPGQDTLPSTFKLGFSASTGADTNFHEIRNLNVAQPADLQVTVDGPASAAPGEEVTYTVVGTNNGTVDALGALMEVPLSAAFSNISWTCAAASGAVCNTDGGTGTVAENIDLPVGGSVTLTITATTNGVNNDILSANPEITVQGVGAVIDPDLSNNAAERQTQLTRTADLAVTVSGPATAAPGDTIDYTVTATNNGPLEALGATVAANLSTGLTNVSWTCTAASGAVCNTNGGTGTVSENVDLPVGGSISLTITTTTDGVHNDTLTASAEVTTPTGTGDPTPANNTASQQTQLIQSADVAVTLSGPDTAAPGEIVSYTVVASNNGTSDITGSTVSATLSTAFTNLSWTCVAASGAVCNTNGGLGAASEDVALPVGGSITLTVTAIANGVHDDLLDVSAEVTVPVTASDPDLTNNTATHQTRIIQLADLALTLSGPDTAAPGEIVSYTIVATNNGTSDIPETTVAATLSAGLSNVGWTCVAASGAVCNTNGGLDTVSESIALPVGGSITLTVTAIANGVHDDILTVGAEITVPTTASDPDLSNNTTSLETRISIILGVPTLSWGSLVLLLAGLLGFGVIGLRQRRA